MCGIAGKLSFRQKVVEQELKAMTNALNHRGPDGEGHWINERKNVGFGHRRLSIIDLSIDGKQPMSYANNRYTITYNGEIYNYIELKENLQKKGYQFRTQTDTEVLLALYAEKGEKCLSDLDGMFAFAIWDELKQELFCARDRFGEKPFFYYKSDQHFVFGSEMKALWANEISKEANLEQVYYYLAYGSTENPYNKTATFYENIYRLEPAHYLVVKANNEINKKRYWDIDLAQQSEISFSEATANFYTLLETSIRRRLRSDVTVGSSLSGGLDSSSIVTIIDKIKGKDQEQKTFSARFSNFERDEGEFMQEVIDACNVEPHFTWLEPEGLLKQMDKVFYHQEEPFNSNSIIAQWNVMQLAKEKNVTVLLDGQGADEILAGYGWFQNIYLQTIRKTNKALFLSEKLKLEENFSDFTPQKSRLKEKIASNVLIRQASNFRNYYYPIASPYFKQFKADFFHDNKHAQAPKGRVHQNLSIALKYATTSEGLTTLLRYADRNAMAHSREVRLPFLNHELVTFLFSLPDSFKIKNGWTKFILRKAIEGIVPDKIVWRKDKIGFAPPKSMALPDEILKESIHLLDEKDIIRKDKSISSLAWKYYQVYKLFQNNI